MADLTVEMGVMLVLVNLRVLKLQLTGQPKAAEVYNDICGHLDALTAEQSVYQGLWDQQVANTAELGYADSVLGGEMSKVNRRVLVEVSGDRSDPRYVAIFPENPSEAMKGAPTTPKPRMCWVCWALLLRMWTWRRRSPRRSCGWRRRSSRPYATGAACWPPR